MRFGLVTPIVSLNPAVHNAWEREATVEDLGAIARAADQAGLHHLTVSDHAAVPVDIAEARGGRYYEPATTLAYIAALTTRIRLATHVLVLGYRHPLEVAKQFGTLDLLSGGRLILGVGVGTLKEEFELLGAEFEGRGEVADDRIRAIRAALGEGSPSYAGAHVDFAEVVLEPRAAQAHVPIWVGGQSLRSLRRAIELGDGWVPFGITTGRLRDILIEAKSADWWQERDGFEIVTHPRELLDPLNDPDHVRAVVTEHEALGATVLNVRLRHNDLGEARAQIQALTIESPV